MLHAGQGTICSPLRLILQCTRIAIKHMASVYLRSAEFAVTESSLQHTGTHTYTQCDVSSIHNTHTAAAAVTWNQTENLTKKL